MEVTLVYNLRSPFGGAYVHLLNNVIGATEAGFLVHLYPTTGISKFINEDLEFLGFEGKVDEVERPRGLIYLRPTDLKSDIKYLKIFKKVDVIEMNSMPLWLAAERAEGFKGALKFLASALRDPLVRLLLFKSKKVITVSSIAAELLKRDAFVEAEAVPNQPLPGLGELVEEGEKLCFSSSYYYSYQGLDVFIGAVKKYKLEKEVLLIGKAAVEGIERVEAKGIKELAKVYSLCKALISPHKDSTPVPFFGSPTKVVDALATNKALVASNLPSIEETIKANLAASSPCVRLVRPGDVDDLGEALRWAAELDSGCVYEKKEGPITAFWKRLYAREATSLA